MENQIKRGRLTKTNINNRDYNKYLKLTGEVVIEIDYEKFNNDKIWDGIKCYITNTKLSEAEFVDNYKNLWHIEKAFRMPKTDLRIKPLYHRLRNRIQVHVCISFTSYCIYKELERVLYEEKTSLLIKRASELTHNMYTLPDSKQTKSRLLNMDDEQTELYRIIKENF